MEFSNIKERIIREFDMLRWRDSNGYSKDKIVTWIKNTVVEVMMIEDKSKRNIIVVEWWNSRKQNGSITTHVTVESAATELIKIINDHDSKLIRDRQLGLF